MQELQLADYLVFAGAGMFVLGYLIINQVILRIMLLVGTLLYIWYYGVVDDTPLWPAIWASSATGTANILGLLSLFYSRSALAIPRGFQDIYKRFANLPPGDFAKLVRASERVHRPGGHRLVTEGAQVATLYYILEGNAQVTKGSNSFEIAEDSFVGEVGYLTGNPASATAELAQDSVLLEWDVAILRKRARRDPRFKLALEALISLDLAEKVSRSVRTHTQEPTVL